MVQFEELLSEENQKLNKLVAESATLGGAVVGGLVGTVAGYPGVALGAGAGALVGGSVDLTIHAIRNVIQSLQKHKDNVQDKQIQQEIQNKIDQHERQIDDLQKRVPASKKTEAVAPNSMGSTGDVNSEEEEIEEAANFATSRFTTASAKSDEAWEAGDEVFNDADKEAKEERKSQAENQSEIHGQALLAKVAHQEGADKKHGILAHIVAGVEKLAHLHKSKAAANTPESKAAIQNQILRTQADLAQLRKQKNSLYKK